MERNERRPAVVDGGVAAQGHGLLREEGMMTIENTTGQRWSDLSMIERFVLGWEQLGYEGGDMTPEHQFVDDRAWRFDLAWPSVKIAIEFDGMGYGHQAINRLRQNYEKQNEAAALGWRVLRFESRQLSMKRLPEVIEQVMRAMQTATAPTEALSAIRSAAR